MKHKRKRAVALVLVIIVMALATIMAYGLLINSSLQARTAATDGANAQADAVAESGVAAAMYYLQHPQYAPAYNAVSGNTPAYWPGSSNLQFTNLNGSANVTVAPSGASGYAWAISSTGSATSHGKSYSKAISTTALTSGIFQVNAALQCNSTVTVGTGMSVTNNTVGSQAISCNGIVHLIGSASVTGNIAAPSVSHIPVWNYSTLAPPIYGPNPPIAVVRSYQNYSYQGSAGSAANFNWVLQLLSFLFGSNPLGFIYSNTAGTNVLTGNKTFPGMFYLPNGDLAINSGTATFGPVPAGFPALVVGGQIKMGNGARLVVNGVCYAGNGIGSYLGNSTGSQIIVNGALLLGGANFTAYSGTLNVTYNAAAVSIPDFTTSPPYLTMQNVKLTTYSP